MTHRYIKLGLTATVLVAAFVGLLWSTLQDGTEYFKHVDEVMTNPQQWEGKPLQLIDTRPKHFASRQQDIAEGVAWRDPERVSEWMGELSKEKPVVVYCAYGFHVGCRTAVTLREAGFDARYMTVGHSGWKAVGAPVRMGP